MSIDRVVMARNGEATMEVVRYDRASKWYLEPVYLGTLLPRQRVSINQAVEAAVFYQANGGEVFLGQPGGHRFDALMAARGVVR